MRCKGCNERLTDFESTRRSTRLGDYVDLCATCIAPILNVFDTSENFGLFDDRVDTFDLPDVHGGGEDMDEDLYDGQDPFTSSDDEPLT